MITTVMWYAVIASGTWHTFAAFKAALAPEPDVLPRTRVVRISDTCGAPRKMQPVIIRVRNDTPYRLEPVRRIMHALTPEQVAEIKRVLIEKECA